MTLTTSCITVCLNARATLQRTLDSVLRQTHPVDQYIIVDGGSTDGTLDIIRSYEALFAGRLEWLSEKDTGMYNAMNKGLERTTGDIIGILNADDWYETDALACVLAEATDKQPGVYYGMVRKWQDGHERSIIREHHNFLWQDMIPHPASFVHSTVYRDFGFFDESYALAGDYELMLRLSQKNVNFYPIDRILGNFSMGGRSISRARSLWLETIKIRRQYGTLSPAQYVLFRCLIEARSFVERFLLRERML